MPAKLDFRMISDKDFIGYSPVLENANMPVPISDTLNVKHFVITEEVDGCSFFINPNTAMSVCFNSDDNSQVDIKVVNLDSDHVDIEQTISKNDWPARLYKIVSSYQGISRWSDT